MTEIAVPGTGQLPPLLPSVPVRWVGYHRAEVDAHLADLAMRLEAERSRADEAEAALAEARSAIIAEARRPPPGLGELARRVAIVHRQAGAAADALLVETGKATGELAIAGELAAAQVLRRARHRALDIELAGREAVESAISDHHLLDSEARRYGDRLHALAVGEGRQAIGEAREAVAMIRAEADARRRALIDEIDELERLRKELAAHTARFNTRLDRVLPPVQRGGGATPALPPPPAAERAVNELAPARASA